jgi:hypothetical protein
VTSLDGLRSRETWLQVVEPADKPAGEAMTGVAEAEQIVQRGGRFVYYYIMKSQ